MQARTLFLAAVALITPLATAGPDVQDPPAGRPAATVDLATPPWSYASTATGAWRAWRKTGA